jgi:glycopeptide antibiotics resistance protein
MTATVGVFFLTLGSAVAATLAVPSAGGVLVHARRHPVPAATLAARLLLILVLAVLLVYTLPYWNPSGYVPPGARTWNLVPGRTIALQIDGLDYNTRESVRQLAGNFGFFVLVGLLLPPAWRRARRFGVTLLSGLAITIGIELTQLVSTYTLPVWPRTADIDDVILNALGVVFGWCIWRLAHALRRGIGAG